MSGETLPIKAPRPARCRTRIDESDGQLELRSRRFSARQAAATAFLAVWLTGWSAGCWMLLQLVAADPSLRNVLFAIPFVTAWIVVSGVLIGQLFGRQRLRIDSEGLTYEFRAIAPLRRRSVPLDELKQAVPAFRANARSGEPSAGMRIETVGMPVEFGQDLDPDEVYWLIQRVNEQIDSLLARRPTTHSRSGAEAAAPKPQCSVTGAETLTATARPLAAPSDSRYALDDDFEELRFVRNGRWSLATVAALTFMNLFWNGAVSVFVWHIVDEFQWVPFFFLIPFEAIGLAMLVGWVLALAAPALRERWTFRRDEIAHRQSLFGLGWTRRYRVERVDRLELQWRPAGADARQPGLVNATDSQGEYLLSFISQDQQIILQIKKLTEGEARWIGDQVLRARAGWFPHARFH